jgi:hypothetical protein
LRRLFCQGKVNLRRLLTFREQEEHLMNISTQWEAEEIGYANDSTSKHYLRAVRNKQKAQKQLTDNFDQQHQINIDLDLCQKEIKQICFELEKIYDGKFDCKYESIREYYLLLDDLRFDPSIMDIKHDFINDLYAFTIHHFDDID